jgi:tRNA-2-methylthio-N6-dimethylallyladenosine synthase
VAELPKVCDHFNIPLQAGDNDVLARMRRGYVIEEYLEWVHRIREIVPKATLSTDVIIGFCGETEAQFERTLGVLEELRFDKVHVAAYSPRPGTIAWRHMEDTVPQEEKMRRLHAVEALQERVASEINAKLVGTVQEVLVEGEKDGVLTGRNRGNKLVHVREEEGSRKMEEGVRRGIGDLVDVRILKATAWSLQGELVEAVVAR